ncbi:MAG: hypothetical protein BJ554DRAFT_8307, partial [Olpidium bornovanus]
SSETSGSAQGRRRARTPTAPSPHPPGARLFRRKSTPRPADGRNSLSPARAHGCPGCGQGEGRKVTPRLSGVPPAFVAVCRPRNLRRRAASTMKVGKFFRKLGRRNSFAPRTDKARGTIPVPSSAATRSCLIPPVHINSKKRRCHNRSESKASSASHQTGFLFPEDSCATSVEGSTHRAEPAAADPAKLKAPDTELAACSTPDDRRARSSSPSAPEASGKLVVSVDKTAVETEAAATIAADGVGAKKVATRLVVSKSALVAPCIDAVVVPAILNSNVCENEKTDVGGTEEGRCRCASEATTDSGRESTDAAYYSAESSFVGKTAAQDGGMLGDSAHWEYSGSAGEGSIFGAASPAESLLAQKKDLACDSPSALPMGASPALMTTLLGPNICVQLDSTKTVFSEAPPPNPLLGANNCVKSNSTKTVFSEAPSASAAFAHSVAQDVVLIDTEKAVDELAIADFGSQNAEQTLESSTSAAQAVPAESGVSLLQASTVGIVCHALGGSGVAPCESLAAGYNPTNAKASTVLLGSPEPAITGTLPILARKFGCGTVSARIFSLNQAPFGSQVGHKRVEARNGVSETIYRTYPMVPVRRAADLYL